ncbi:MAG TPA: ATP-binding protein [Planctomycetota bacterium]|nr:ATP-binding protein [Planctomycetota bacterium]
MTDPDIGVVIPAPGFARVPTSDRWDAFLALALGKGAARAALPFPSASESAQCTAVACGEHTVAVFIGGEPAAGIVQAIVALLPLIGDRFRCEQGLVNTRATMALARNAAKQLREQAAVLEQARRTAHLEVVERRRAELALQQKAVELERSNRDLQQFAATVSHDLQEPLRMVSNYLTLIERRALGLVDERTREYFRFAGEGTLRMSALIRALLDYAQVGAADRALVTVPVEAVVREATENLAHRIAETGAHVSVLELPNVRGDHVLLVQLFQNLISNALKFVDKGVTPRVTVDSVRAGAWWTIRIADNGIGIPPEHRDRIFRVFQRLHTRDAFEGSGIGLATCQRIVELHGGALSVESTVGKGSVFSLRIPAI